MITKHVVVLPYDPRWALDFQIIRDLIREALGPLALGIEHVGSTSVRGLSAKPIIDLDVIIRDNTLLNDVIAALRKIGYEYEGDLGIAGREAFKYTGQGNLPAHHLYVCPKDSAELKRHLASLKSTSSTKRPLSRQSIGKSGYDPLIFGCFFIYRLIRQGEAAGVRPLKRCSC